MGTFRPFNSLISFLSTRLFKLKIAPVVWLDESSGEDRTLLRESVIGFAYGPDDNVSQPAKLEVKIPAIYYYMLRDVAVTNNTSSFLTRESLIIERLQSNTGTLINYNDGHLLFRKGRAAIVQVETEGYIEKGFFLGGNGSFNYYHWLTELLPKVEFLDKVPLDFPFLVSDEVNKYPSFKEALMLLAPDREVFYLLGGKQYLVKQLINITTASNLPFNVDQGVNFAVADFLISFASLNFLRNSILKHKSGKGNTPKRIFLKRDNNRRTYNQDEVEAITLKYNFESVQCEKMSFLDQVSLFSNADIIIGPTGAAWSNMVFARQGCKALCWMATEFNTFSSFSTLAAFAKVDLKYFYYTSGAKSTSELYNSSYHVDVGIFESYLRTLLASAEGITYSSSNEQ